MVTAAAAAAINAGEELARDMLPRGTKGRLEASNWERARSRELLFSTRCMADWSLCLTSAAFCENRYILVEALGSLGFFLLTSWMNMRRAAGSVGTLDVDILVGVSSDSLSSLFVCDGINCSEACVAATPVRET